MLGIPWPASRDAVVRAFREQTMIWHPDRCARPEATQRMQEINAARDALLSVLGTVTPHASVRAPRRSRSRANPDDGRTGIRCPLTHTVIIGEDGMGEDGLELPPDPLRRLFSRQITSQMVGRNPTKEMFTFGNVTLPSWEQTKRLCRALGTLFGGRNAIGNAEKQRPLGAIIGQHKAIDDSLLAEARFVSQCGHPVMIAQPSVECRITYLVIVSKDQIVSDRIRDRLIQEKWDVKIP